jgi:hypothetical protein
VPTSVSRVRESISFLHVSFALKPNRTTILDQIDIQAFFDANNSDSLVTANDAKPVILSHDNGETVQ